MNGDQVATWRITYQQEGYDTTPGAPIVRGVTIGFMVDDQVQSSVFVPQNEYTPTRVREIISVAASKVAAIQGLTHQSAPEV